MGSVYSLDIRKDVAEMQIDLTAKKNVRLCVNSQINTSQVTEVVNTVSPTC